MEGPVKKLIAIGIKLGMNRYTRQFILLATSLRILMPMVLKNAPTAKVICSTTKYTQIKSEFIIIFK